MATYHLPVLAAGKTALRAALTGGCSDRAFRKNRAE
jgi:hypothetical protein